ncbi:aldo/keto reductase family protein [Anaeromyxobacter diazotrophicus]|uniref:Aldo/keto reductase n=1 Tax=Anaeromyxobacter diazotrophicus TaxID=2590199 RepID=A0A7I9VS90_9BACT|nr:aldo/keto reductase family protein [Anaeromyxobacter diazotrophicus]GEJ58980.1 aldo/keto reductase [Anaeromyxobacter diazotrophicus]
MQYRKLGRSDLAVSEIALGSWLTYGGGVPRERAEACVRRAFDEGINFFDTANVYALGAAESFLGAALAGVPRDRYVLATKVYFPMSPQDQGLSAAQIAKQLDASLRRLRVDHVDLYQCHRYDERTPLEETMAALTRAVEQGKTRYVGFSEWSPDQIRAALALPGARFVSSQPQYSLLWRSPEEEVFPLCAREGIGNIVWSPLGQGVLTGKYRPGHPPPADSRAASEAMGGFLQKRLDEHVLAGVQRLRPIAAELGLTLPELALAWVLRRSEVTAAIIGASRPEQVTENVRASGVKLDAAVLARIDQALA